jgi:hypothetical protein
VSLVHGPVDLVDPVESVEPVDLVDSVVDPYPQHCLWISVDSYAILLRLTSY